MKDAAARATDPTTAHDAAASVNTNHYEQIVVDYIREHGPSTTHEIADGTGLEYATVTPRIKPLTRKNKVRDSGEVRSWRSGRKSIVWELVT